MKIFPRNLTARADYVVRGNPASSRTESGVDNCYPGLEFDQRNLDKAFFPGLTFEFHRAAGAVLVGVAGTGVAAEAGLRRADLGPPDNPLFLWALLGPPPVGGSPDTSVSLRDRNGLETWRVVHDLLPGRILVVIGRGSSGLAPPFTPRLDTRLHEVRDAGESGVQRDAAGVLNLAILVGERAAYLDDDGVIDPAAYPPGELTRTLCAPWQFDFRDCGCFYWAATKPDIVVSSDGTVPYVNFMRRDRSEPPEIDVSTESQERRQKEFDYAELIEGAWNDLAVVVDDRENLPAAHPPLPSVELMGRQEVIDELVYLGTVEHALCVEYLYAHYSLDAPLALPEDPSPSLVRIFAAAREVFNIAVDEMRHLRWVNEVLNLLGQPPSVGRAKRIGRQLDRPFALEPLMPTQLQWFIDVERPSQDLTGALDGMYVRLHTSIMRQPELFPEADRMVELIKLIIDEGDDHCQRFSAIQRHLDGVAADDYLRPLADPTEPRLTALQDLSDQNYAVVIGALETTFSLGDRAGGVLLEQARRAMFNLHETNHYMAGHGVRPRFKLPRVRDRQPLTRSDAHELTSSLNVELRRSAAAVVADGDEGERALAERVLQRNQELFDAMHRLIDEDLE